MPLERPAYRPDIEGLRGVAILLVVAFHAGVSRLSGGFVGVDVFFVLSGFFITGLLAREVSESGTIDLTEFSQRHGWPTASPLPCAPNTSRGDGCDLITSYSLGWVNAG